VTRGGTRVEQSEQRPHLADRLLPGRADRLQDLAGAGGVALEQPFGGANLQHDHAEAMRDDVVELARDPPPLLSGGLGRASLLLALERLGASLEAARAGPNRPPGQPHAHGEDGEARAPDGLAERVDQRIRYRQDHDARQRQRQRDKRCAPVHDGGVDRRDVDEHAAPALAATVRDRQGAEVADHDH
jgi:hypothetical protein